MIHVYKSIDAHVGGQTLRLIVEGMPAISGRTMLRQRESLRRQADAVRRALVLEPRGHAGMTAAVFTAPPSPQSHAGLLFMDGDGYPSMSGHAVIAAATIAIERGLLFPGDADEAETRIVFDTPAGIVPVRARVETRGGASRVDAVAFSNVPSFVHTAAHPVRVGTRELRVDIAFGGSFHAIVDTEAIGIPLRMERLADLRRLGDEIRRSLNAELDVRHPLEPALRGVDGIVFTGPPEDPEAHLRSVAASGHLLDRSPSGTGTSAVMAVLDAMGLLPDDQAFVHESLTGALFRGRCVRRMMIGELPALVPEIEGTAWITGEHTFLVDDDEPLRDGFTF